MATFDLGVPTMHCRSCKLTLEETLDDLDGVADRIVDLDARRISVFYDPSAIERSTITAAIEQAGYPVSV